MHGIADSRRGARGRFARNVNVGRLILRIFVVFGGVARNGVIGNSTVAEIIEVVVNRAMMRLDRIVFAARIGNVLPFVFICRDSGLVGCADDVLNRAVRADIAAAVERDFRRARSNTDGVFVARILEVIGCAAVNRNNRAAFDTLDSDVVIVVGGYRDKILVNVSGLNLNLCVVDRQGDYVGVCQIVGIFL